MGKADSENLNQRPVL